MSFVVFLLPVFVLGMTLFNLVTWPRRGRPGEGQDARVSVLIPARDEAETIEDCLRAVLTSTVPAAEILVYDDGSADSTAEIVSRLAAEHPIVRLVRGSALPAGWVGKPHACHRLAELAQGDSLLFIDADTRLSPIAIDELSSIAGRHNADVLTGVPRQRMVTVAEQLILPLLHITYTSWFPLILTYLSPDVRFLAANGQLLWVRRSAYDGFGGFSAVRSEVVDDMAFCRQAKASGHRVVFADAHRLATCRMYAGMADIWSGFSKNLYLGIGARPAALVLVVLLYTATFIAPWAALVAGLAGAQAWLWPGILAVGANLLQRLAHVVRNQHPISGLLLSPVAVLIFIAIAVNSWRWTSTGKVRWRGRTYATGPSPLMNDPVKETP